MGTPLAQSGHPDSGQAGTWSSRSERAGTGSAPGGSPRFTIEAAATVRAPICCSISMTSRVDLPVVNTSSTTTTGASAWISKPRRSVNAPSCRSAKRNGRFNARATSWPMMMPPIAGETTRAGANSDRSAASSPPAASARSGHWSSLAHWRYRSECNPDESRKCPVRSAPVSSKSGSWTTRRSYQLSLKILLPRDLVVLDLLVEVRPRRVDDFGGPADVPAVLSELRHEELALRVFLELRERRQLEAPVGYLRRRDARLRRKVLRLDRVGV